MHNSIDSYIQINAPGDLEIDIVIIFIALTGLINNLAY
jgi:hypothetical protein